MSTSRVLEGVFVIGCSLVGAGMSAPQASQFQNSVQFSVQLVAHAQDNIAAKLSSVPSILLKHLRID